MTTNDLDRLNDKLARLTYVNTGLLREIKNSIDIKHGNNRAVARMMICELAGLNITLRSVLTAYQAIKKGAI